MGFFNKYRKMVSVCDGECKPLSQMSDEAFASEMLGKGFMIEPRSNYFYSPCDGKIESITDSKHAYTITTEDNLDVLIHIGVDTVSLNGDCFDCQAVIGQKIKAGDLIAIADLEKIKKQGLDTATAVVVANPENIEKLDFNYGTVLGGKDICMSFKISS